jgi:hypothetical protein
MVQNPYMHGMKHYVLHYIHETSLHEHNCMETKKTRHVIHDMKHQVLNACNRHFPPLHIAQFMVSDFWKLSSKPRCLVDQPLLVELVLQG